MKGMNLRAEVVFLTPEMASDLLSRNSGNRNLRIRYAHRLAMAITRGEWKLNGETICVSAQGRLLQGQHRCKAVCLAGIGIWTVMVSGVDESVFHTYDTGIGRTVGDVLQIEGQPNARLRAAISVLVHKMRTAGDPYHGNPDYQPTRQQQIDLIASDPLIGEAASDITSKKWCTKHMTQSLGGFCLVVFRRKDRVAADAFFESLETGIGLTKNSPVYLLRERLIDNAGARSRLTQQAIAHLTFKAFRLYLDGAQLRTLRVRYEGDGPEKNLYAV